MKQLSIILLAGVVGILLAWGCASTEKKPEATGAHPQFEELCSKCHTMDRVHAAHQTLTKQQMRTIMENMSHKPGADFDSEDIDNIFMEIY